MSDTEKKQRAKRTPKNADSILAGLLKLDLQEKVKLQKLLTENINKEVAEIQKAADYAQSLISGQTVK